MEKYKDYTGKKAFELFAIFKKINGRYRPIMTENYTGEIKFRFKRSPKYQYYTFKRFLKFITEILIEPITYKEYEVGDKIGQIVILPIPSIELVEVDKLPETDRGSDGFGSSDTKVRRSRKKKVE